MAWKDGFTLLNFLLPMKSIFFFGIGEELRQKFGKDVHFYTTERRKKAKIDTWRKKLILFTVT